MKNIYSLSHTKWESKYHVVWIPKSRRKMLYGQRRKYYRDVFHDLAYKKESKVLEGNLKPDHVHMMLAISPKYTVSQVVGYMKGKKRDPHCSELPWAKEELCWHEFFWH